MKFIVFYYFAYPFRSVIACFVSNLLSAWGAGFGLNPIGGFYVKLPCTGVGSETGQDRKGGATTDVSTLRDSNARVACVFNDLGHAISVGRDLVKQALNGGDMTHVAIIENSVMLTASSRFPPRCGSDFRLNCIIYIVVDWRPSTAGDEYYRILSNTGVALIA